MILAVIEYSAAILGIIGAVLISFKRREGFACWIVNNALWVVFGYLTKNYGLMGQFIIFWFISVHGFRYWGRK